MAIEVGQKAPAFSLQNTDKAHVSLESFQGKSNVVILFFPLAFSGVCTTELCSTRDNISIYEGLDAEILAISVDSFFTLEAFKKDNRREVDYENVRLTENTRAAYPLEHIPGCKIPAIGKSNPFIFTNKFPTSNSALFT